MGVFRTAHAAISRYAAWPLFGRIRSTVRRGHQELGEALEWYRLDRSEVERRQIALLRKLLSEAGRQCPFYRDTFERLDFAPDSIRELADLERLPSLTRHTVQTRVAELRSRDESLTLVADASGGSSGLPVIVYHTPESGAANVASKLASDMIAGYRLGHPMGMLWGGHAERNAIQRWRARSLMWALNTPYYDSFDMDEERMAAYHAELSRRRPDVILCYASSLHLFAGFLESRELKPNYPRRGLITSAEALTSVMRADIGRVFDAPVFNRYGSREVGMLGMECERHDGMHVVNYNAVVEVVDPLTQKAVRNEPGEVLVTLLRNYGMPLIRYELGDMAVLSDAPCGCGRPGPMLKTVLGRTCDTVRLPSGRLVHGEYFTHLLYGLEGVLQFRFVQHDLHHYDLLMVTDARYQRKHDDELRGQIVALAGPEAEVRIEHVEYLAPLPSGKRQFVHSRLAPVMSGKR